MQGKATNSNFSHLYSIFITHHTPKVIEQMQKKVVNYKQALQRQAELLMEQKHLQNKEY